ncbi:hypothetical protein NKJ40_07375 [Mesorhizobium sp. M0119]|uniref:hypothetical protein n=1 Tax=unclassified Mesorhizobium TaxID=325217 RepID=UPI0033360BB5
MAEIPDKGILMQFARSVRELLNDDDLIKAAPEEFSITADLAMKMERHYPGWRVSPEWTRRETEEKRVAWNDKAGLQKLKKIRPDIIVHHMHKEENLLVVEAKRLGNTDFEDDVRKLRLMTLDHSVNPLYHYGYRVGVHLVLDLPNRLIVNNDVYRNGEIHADLTGWLWRLLH